MQSTIAKLKKVSSLGRRAARAGINLVLNRNKPDVQVEEPVWPPEQWPPVRPYPLVYFIEPSSICNAACIFCHYKQQKDAGKPIKDISNVTFDKAIEFIKEDCKKRNVRKVGVSLTPTTGDVLVNKNWGDFVTKLLELDFADRVDLVTNGILLNEKNIETLCNLPNLHKFDFAISTGGLDKETYEFMFATDKFDKVKKNVNNLLRTLKERDIVMNVWVNLRIPESADISHEKVEKVYNEAGYKWATYSWFDTFKDVPIPNTDDELGRPLKRDDTIEPRDHDPCGMLQSGTLNFNADEKITACGCHYSQKPGDNSLLLGDINTPHEELDKKRKALVNDWKENNIVPEVCKTCQHYHHHVGLENIGLKF